MGDTRIFASSRCQSFLLIYYRIKESIATLRLPLRDDQKAEYKKYLNSSQRGPRSLLTKEEKNSKEKTHETDE